jgi:predicted TIM-barrel fold metal-dependent hydrolase
MKVSGLVEGLDTPQTDAVSTLAQCRDALDHVYQAFGPDRLIFGTNWPVSQPKGEMTVVKGIIHRYFEPKGKEVLAKVFAGNAKRIYRYVNR